MNYLLVHGAWMTQQCWSQAIEELTKRGHRAAAFDLPGHGADATPLSELSLALYAAKCIEYAEELGGDVALVGHSMAGIVLSAAAESRPDLFKSLTYVAAYLVADGQSLNDLAMTDADSQVGPNLRPAADWSTLDLVEESRAGVFFHDVPAPVAQVFLESWAAEPTAPQTTPVKVTEERFGSVPRRYVHTLHDRVVSPNLQKRMLSASPATTVEMATGHLPMLAESVLFVETLVNLK